MREVEAQPVRRNQRAFLRDVIAEHLAQRLMQQMRRRVVGADRRAARVIDGERERLANLQRPLFHLADVDEQVAGFLLRIGYGEANAVRVIAPVSPVWPPDSRIERRLVDDDGTALAGLEFGDFLAVAHQRRDDAFRRLRLVAEEFGRAEPLADRKPDGRRGGIAGARPRRARLLSSASPSRR